MSDFYTSSGAPAYRSGPTGTSAAMRGEFAAIQAAMAKLAGYTGNGSKFLRVNAVGSAYEAITVAEALAALAPNSAALATALADTTGTGVFVRTQAPTLTSANLVTPALGTPASGVLTNCTGTAAGLTAGNVTTNANLTGDVTSVGNAATVKKINGTALSTLATGILKNTTTTGVPSIAVAADFPTLNQNTTGSSGSCTGNAATATNATNATNVTGSAAVSGAVSSSSPTAGIGYATGAGGSVTQLTSKSTAVTLNKICGQITMHSELLGANTIVSFNLNNSVVLSTDVINVTASFNTGVAYIVNAAYISPGIIRIYLHNRAGVGVSEAVLINFEIKRIAIS